MDSVCDRVLYVDDDADVRLVFSRILERANIPVRVAKCAEDGLALLDAQPGAYAAVFADYIMPGMDGAVFLKQVAEIAPWATRVLVSGNLDLPNVVRAVNQSSIYQILTKPWDTAHLLPLVERARREGDDAHKHAQLLCNMRKRNYELVEMNEELDRQLLERTSGLLEGLLCALDLRDVETQWHSRRVAAFSLRLAGELDLSGQDLQVIESGALLHDLGKIGISDSILLKPGPLTDAEWEVMRTHPELGFNLLSNIQYLQGAAQIVLHHHECFDGTGYPHGLEEEEIAIGARIFSVVDTLDVITTDRPYRKARDFDCAIEEIKRCSGTQFDPQIVDAFTCVPKEEWQMIRRRFTTSDDRERWREKKIAV